MGVLDGDAVFCCYVLKGEFSAKYMRMKIQFQERKLHYFDHYLDGQASFLLNDL